jgi:hypothetical protein
MASIIIDLPVSVEFLFIFLGFEVPKLYQQFLLHTVYGISKRKECGVVRKKLGVLG